MAANITVAGMPREMGGLKESTAAHRKHWKEVGDALLNISGIGTADGKPVDKDEPRIAYKHQSFPRMVYHAENGELVVENDTELTEALRQKYREAPYIKPQVMVEDPRIEKQRLQDSLKTKDGQINTLADKLTKALERLDALEQAGDKKK